MPATRKRTGGAKKASAVGSRPLLTPAPPVLRPVVATPGVSKKDLQAVNGIVKLRSPPPHRGGATRRASRRR
jgi:hypothetical protein